MTAFSEKISILAAKISDDLFLVIDQVFRISPFFLSQIFRIFTMFNVVDVYDPFLTRKTTSSVKNSFIWHLFYSVRAFARIQQHNNATSQNIGGRMHGQSPLGLRLCLGDSPMLKLKCLKGIPRSLKLKCLNCNKFKNYQRKTCTSITFSYISPETR